MHVILGVTTQKRDTQQVKEYLESLKQTIFFREIRFYDIVCDKKDTDFISNILYPAGQYQKLYKKLPSLLKALLGKAGIHLNKPRPEIERQAFLIRSKCVLAIQAEDEELNGKEQI